MISIVMPCYNTEKYVGQAIESVLSQEGEFELIVVNDGSTDGTLQVIQTFHDTRLKVITLCANCGITDALRTGFLASSGDYIVFMGSDDKLEEGYLKYLLEAFDEGAGFVICHQKIFGEDGLEITENLPSHLSFPTPINLPREQWLLRLLNAQHGGFGTPMFRKSVFDEVGFFDESYKQLLDLEMYIRILKADYSMKVVEKPLFWFRMRKGQMSEPNEENSKFHVEQLKRIKSNFLKDRPMKLMIATPFYSNQGFSPYIRSLFQTVYTLARHTKMDFDFQEVSGGSYIDHNRNMMADAFLKSDCTHLMFIDSDQSWDIPGFLNVLKADVDVVGAAYPVKNNWENYGVTIHTDEAFRPIVNAQGLIKADKVPTGFMKIKRCVFERIAASNPNDWYWHGKEDKLQNYFGHLTIDHIRYGEDISFGIRWQRVGGEIWVEPRVNMGHYGAQGWFGNYHEFLCKQTGGSQDPELKRAA